MKCTYCDCLHDGTIEFNNMVLCPEHHNKLKDIKVTGRILGHTSTFVPPEDTEFDCVDEIKLRRNVAFNKLNFD